MDASLFSFSPLLLFPIQEVHVATLSLLRPPGRDRTEKGFEFVRGEVLAGPDSSLGQRPDHGLGVGILQCDTLVSPGVLFAIDDIVGRDDSAVEPLDGSGIAQIPVIAVPFQEDLLLLFPGLALIPADHGLDPVGLVPNSVGHEEASVGQDQ